MTKVVTSVGHGGSIKISGTEEGLKLAAKNVIRLAGDYEVMVFKHGVVSFSHRKLDEHSSGATQWLGVTMSYDTSIHHPLLNSRGRREQRYTSGFAKRVGWDSNKFE